MMTIESNVLEISKAMFKDKDNWKYVTDEQKEKFFFIFNQYFSKRYLELSQLLNDKEINKSVGMDLWAKFMLDKPYPQWFWSKPNKTLKESTESSFYEEIKRIHQLKEDEFNFLLKYHSEEIQEEINYLKLQKNGNTREKLVHSKSSK